MLQRPRAESLRSHFLLAGIGLALALSQTGCPQGADLENPAAWGPQLGTAGSSSGGGTLDWAAITCTGMTATDFMSKTCAKSFCHGLNFVVDLDLRPDAGFVTRTRNIVAKHGGIPCTDDVTKECVPTTCPTDATYVNQQNPAMSWILLKGEGMQGECGDPMPASPRLTADQLDCLTNIVNAAAVAK